MPENFKAPILLKLMGSSLQNGGSASGEEKTRIESLIEQ